MLTHLFAALLATQSPQDCARIESPGERLACFDALFPGERTPVDPESQFGLSPGEQLRRVEPAPAPESIEGAIQSIDVMRDNRRRVVLTNGQIWIVPAQTNKDRLKPGDAISIQTGSFGGFMLKTPNGILVRARRAQ